jgi:predicted outer membrane repeat protein
MTCLLAATVAALLAFAAPAAAQTFTVTNLGNAGGGSLRAAVEESNAAPGADRIVFAAGLTGTIGLSGTGLTINAPLTIEGPGPEALTIAQASKEHRIFKVAKFAAPGGVALIGLHLAGTTVEEGGAVVYYRESNATLTIENCLVTGGSTGGSSYYGGAISGEGEPLVVRDSLFSGNEAGAGGAIWAGGDGGDTATIESSTFVGNHSKTDGGAILLELQEGGLSQIIASTFSGNSSENRGGALFSSNSSASTLLIANSTFSGNQAGEGGGAMALDGDDLLTTVEGSTIASNHVLEPGGEGGALWDDDIQRLIDTIVAGNTASTDPDLHGKWVSAFDLLGSAAGGELTETSPGSDLIGVDPQLGPLADNGGPTETMALPPGSPAVNKGGGGLTTDQRGEVRPVNYPGVALSSANGANGADIGAYELAAPASSGTSPSPPGTNQPPPAKQKKKKLNPPRVRVSCPKGAAPTGCHFALQVVSAKPHRGKGKRAHSAKPVAESLVAIANLRPGRSAEPTLTPKPKFAANLDAAGSLLVHEAATIGGKRTVSYRRLKVVG